jgi:hypothetical protein
MSGRQQRVMVQPIVRDTLLFHSTSGFLTLWQNVIFKNLQQVHPRRMVLSHISIHSDP